MKYLDMERNEMIEVLNGMCERCLIKGIISTLEDAKILYDTFNRFRNNDYTKDEEYSRDVLYLYNLAVNLHENRCITLEESYSIYSAILAADKVEFVEIKENVVKDEIITVAPLKIKKSKKTKVDDGVVDISDIMP
jgi:hypothetical protein